MRKAEDYYGPVAPAWAQHHRWLIRMWAWCRVLGWMLKGVGV